eukprot:1467763-Prorocentrum_lima.AAC.1
MQGIGIDLNHTKTEIWKADAASALPDTMKELVKPSLKVVGSQMLGRDDVAAAMGFGDAGL